MKREREVRQSLVTHLELRNETECGETPAAGICRVVTGKERVELREDPRALPRASLKHPAED